MEKEQKLEKGKVLARMIIEMLGAPKEHIEQTLKEYIESLEKREKLEFVGKKLEPAEEQGKFFNAFAEIEVWFDSMSDLIGFCFDSLPSSVEILEPSHISMQSSEFAGLLNDLQDRIHRIDMQLKDTKAQNMILNNQALRMIYRIIKTEVKDPKSLDQLVGIADLKEDKLKEILGKMVESGELVLEGNLYKLPSGQ